MPDRHRSTQRRAPRGRGDEAALTEAIVKKARAHGRYGYRRVTALRADRWHVTPKRVKRIWRREVLPADEPREGHARRMTKTDHHPVGTCAMTIMIAEKAAETIRTEG